MAGEFFIITFGPEGEEGRPEDLIPLAVIEQHFRPFMTNYRVTDETEHEALLVYPVVRQLPDGSWVPGDTTIRGVPVVNDGEISFTESAPGSGLVKNISFGHHPHHPAFEAGVHAVLASASAVAVGPDGLGPVVGKFETIAHLPPDMIGSMGPPHLARAPEELWQGPEHVPSSPPPPRPERGIADAELNLQRARQAQVVDQARQGVSITFGFPLADLRGMIDRLKVEQCDQEEVLQLEEYAALLEQALHITSETRAPEWDERAAAIMDDIKRFGLPTRINIGALTNRFHERLKRLDAIVVAHAGQRLESAAREHARWVDLDAQARARGLPMLTSHQPDPGEMHLWSDALLLAQRKRSHEQLDFDRHSIWSEFKSSAQFAGEWLDQGKREHPGMPFDDEAQFQDQMVKVRKTAKDTERPDWDDAVLHAVQALLNFDLPARLNARQTPGPFDERFRHEALRRQLALPKQLDDLQAKTIAVEMLDAEIARRGLVLPIRT